MAKNKNAQTVAQVNKMGRPRKFNTPTQMQRGIDSYFSECKSSGAPLTIEGLCEVLEVDRMTLLNYEKQPGYDDFFDTVKKAKMHVQRNLVERGLKGDSNSTMSIFLLKNNHGYEDRSAIEVKDEKIIKGLSKDQLVEIMADE